MTAKRSNNLTAEEIGQKFNAYIEENKENLKDMMVRALWKGVGKIRDETSARLAYSEVCKVCNEVVLGKVLFGDIMGYDLSQPLDLETVGQMLEEGQNLFDPGSGKTMCKGNVSLELSRPKKCICTFTEVLGLADLNDNQCHYGSKEGYRAWHEFLLKKPVDIERIYGVANCGTCGDWKITLKEDKDK